MMAERADTVIVFGEEKGGEATDEGLKQINQAVKNVITSCYADLSSAVSGCLPDFAKEMLQAQLISRCVMKSENFDKIMQDYITCLDLIGSYTELVEKCSTLLGVLRSSSLGGPTKLAANVLQDKWNKVMEGEFGQSFIPQPREKRINSSPVVPSCPPPTKPSYSKLSKTCPSKMDAIQDEPSTDNSQSNEPDNITEESTVPDPPSSHNLTMTRSNSSVSEGFVSGVENRKSLLSFDKPTEQDSGISPATYVSQTPETLHSAPAEETPNHPETTDSNGKDDDSINSMSTEKSANHTAETTGGIKSHGHLPLNKLNISERKTDNDVETPSNYLCFGTEESGNNPHPCMPTSDDNKEDTSSSNAQHSVSQNDRAEQITTKPKSTQEIDMISQTQPKKSDDDDELHLPVEESQSITPQDEVQCGHDHPQGTTMSQNKKSTKRRGRHRYRRHSSSAHKEGDMYSFGMFVREIKQTLVNNIPSLSNKIAYIISLIVVSILVTPLLFILNLQWYWFGPFLFFIGLSLTLYVNKNPINIQEPRNRYIVWVLCVLILFLIFKCMS